MVIAMGGFEPFYFRIFTIDRVRLRANLTDLPYQKLPGLRELLLEVRARTRPGDTIAVYGPFPKWYGGYEYFYARSPYTLAGRRVVALLDADDRPHMENLAQAQWMCAYRSIPAFDHFTLVWRGRDGVLLRRAP